MLRRIAIGLVLALFVALPAPADAGFPPPRLICGGNTNPPLKQMQAQERHSPWDMQLIHCDRGTFRMNICR